MLLLALDSPLLVAMLDPQTSVLIIQIGQYISMDHLTLMLPPVPLTMNLVQETLLLNVGLTVLPQTLAHKLQV